VVNLKKIVTDLDEIIYRSTEESFIKNKAANYLYLLQNYRNSTLTDKEISDNLHLTGSSFYTLKSRLHDRISESLTGDLFSDREEISRHLNEIPRMVCTQSRELTEAFLLKLETELLKYNMHAELLSVYSALKKTRLYSQKYFHYSQCFNKHVAFNLALEKAEEILGKFNLTLGQYFFSRSPHELKTLLFLRNEVADHLKLNPSSHVTIIYNLISLQISVFTSMGVTLGINTEKLLAESFEILDGLPEHSPVKSWNCAFHLLAFENYCANGQDHLARRSYETVNANFPILLLQSHICVTPRFLLSKLSYLKRNGFEQQTEETDDLLTNEDDLYGIMMLRLYRSVRAMRRNDLKKAISLLNDVLNDSNLKECSHFSVEIKLALAFMYIEATELDLAENLLRSLTRKLKTPEMIQYGHAMHLIKVLAGDLKSPGSKTTARQRDEFALFATRNSRDYEILSFMLPDLAKKYK
jgi:hypothetical protein